MNSLTRLGFGPHSLVGSFPSSKQEKWSKNQISIGDPPTSLKHSVWFLAECAKTSKRKTWFRLLTLFFNCYSSPGWSSLLAHRRSGNSAYNEICHYAIAGWMREIRILYMSLWHMPIYALIRKRNDIYKELRHYISHSFMHNDICPYMHCLLNRNDIYNEWMHNDIYNECLDLIT